MKTRPTSDRVKESVFGILGVATINAKVLDLFAGTGNLGLEALSRGADSAVLVDKNAQSVKLILENATLTGFAGVAAICREDVLHALRRLYAQKKNFDLIFCDPPYNLGLAAQVLIAMDSEPILRESGVLVLEHSRHEKLPEGLKRIVGFRSEMYGETVVSFFAKQEGTDSESCSVPGKL